MRHSKILFAFPLLLATPLAPAAAQVATSITAGTQVVDAKGGVVGTVIAVDQTTYTVKTDRHEAKLPRASFTPDKGKLLFAMTRDELNAAVDKEVAKSAAMLVAGAAVKSSDGVSVGTIESIDSEFATIKLTSEQTVKVPRSGISGTANGVIIGVTAAQLNNQVAKAATASTAPSSNSVPSTQ